MAAKDENGKERKSHYKESDETKNAGKPSAKDEDRQSEAQKKAVERYEDQNREVQLQHARVNINTKLVTKEFKGNVPSEPFKLDEEEDAKVGRFGFGAG